jgi:hypothetical protein
MRDGAPYRNVFPQLYAGNEIRFLRKETSHEAI